ncbi:hydroxyethylthiazole kinase [Shouchella shacheensis]|uniref:hydroxyethylthiazole kinase n=1 Tax=Shouchella shacheensis TaxID=1649580 RepID=UPI0007400DC9|nr:hydroxyethylthiazole kinase [Shouchella shacheensis]
MGEMIRKANPLIHCMTNVVVTNFTANGMLAVGASPVMAYDQEESADMAGAAKALLLNIGTPSVELGKAMVSAGQAANKAGIPVVLDPVGIGATSFRSELCKLLLEEVDISIIRGNAGEVAALLGKSGTVKGVDGQIQGDSKELARKAAETFHCVTIVTGEIDCISDGHQVKTVANGHPWLSDVVGTGCLLGGVVAAYASQNKDDLVTASTEAVVFYGVAAERAYEKTAGDGLGSFRTEFINQLGKLTDAEAKESRRTE